MSAVCAITRRRPQSAGPQAKAARQWLGGYQREVEWLRGYSHAQQECLRQVDGKRMKLRQTPIMGDCLQKLTASLVLTEDDTETDFAQKRPVPREDLIATGGQQHSKRSRAAARQRDDSQAETAPAARNGGQGSPGSIQPSAAMAKRQCCQVDDARLRNWSGTSLPFAQASPSQPKSALTAPGRKQAGSAHKVNDTPQSRSTERQRQWHEQPLQRVRRALTGAEATATPKRANGADNATLAYISKGAPLGEQFQSLLQRPRVSSELLTRIISDSAASADTHRQTTPRRRRDDNVYSANSSPARHVSTAIPSSVKQAAATTEQSGQTALTEQSVQTALNQQTRRATAGAAKADQVTGEQAQTEVASHSTRKRSSSPQDEDLKTVDYKLTEDLLTPLADKADAPLDDVALAQQIKRILDEEARRYGIDI